MKQKTVNAYLITFVLLAIASIIMLHQAKRHDTASNNQIIASYADNVTYEVFNKNGNLDSLTTAKTATHYKGSEETVFTNPQVLTYTTDRKPWLISANNAKSNATNDRIFLWGHVNIHKLSQHKKSETTIKTTELTVFPKDSRATTPKNITIYQNKNVIYGKGFTANLNSGVYKLLSQSEGIYHP